MIDPYRILGIPPTSDDEVVRKAYLEAIRNCPPERDPRRFERIRAAYELVRDPRRRLEHELFNCDQPTAEEVLESLLAHAQPRRPSLPRLLRVLGGG